MNTTDQPTGAGGGTAAIRGEWFTALCLLAALAGTLFLDRLTNVLLVLSTFLFAVVARYSRRYLAGDRGQGRFTFWLCLTGLCVFGLILAQSLLLFSAAWLGTSLSLHQLLQFYAGRPGALLAARKKFLISRLGDCALAGALWLTQATFGTWDFQKIFAAAEPLRQAGLQPVPASIHWIAILLAFAALLKSAQFPFHSWLPDTMETPTPVSALMHAGIINGGGILVIRLSPLISLSEAALLLLALVGGFTAVFASVIMLTQASVKRQLAFSTVAQMGFMILECGLGAFHLAVLHMVAHSLYKAYAFLSSGSSVSLGPRALPRRTTPAWALVAGLVCAAAIIAAVSTLAGARVLEQPVLTAIFGLAPAQMLWSCWSGFDRARQIPMGLALGAGFAAIFFALEHAAALVVPPVLQRSINPVAGALLFGLFGLAALLQVQLPRIARTPFGARLYVHARNGFYCNTLANRMTAALWPVPTSSHRSPY